MSKIGKIEQIAAHEIEQIFGGTDGTEKTDFWDGRWWEDMIPWIDPNMPPSYGE